VIHVAPDSTSTSCGPPRMQIGQASGFFNSSHRVPSSQPDPLIPRRYDPQPSDANHGFYQGSFAHTGPANVSRSLRFRPMSHESDQATRHEYTASLRVSSRAISLADMADRLGEPSSGHDIGDPISRRPGAGRRRHAMWSRDSGLDRSRPLDEHIEALVAFAEANPGAIDSLRAECDIDIFCGLFSGTTPKADSPSNRR
jgi:hypothetical protein